jgi:ATP-binding cassette subfamily B protein
MKSLRTLNKFFWKYRWRLIIGVGFVVLTNLFTVYAPKIIKEAVNFLNEAFDKQDNLTEEGVAQLDLPQSLSWIDGVLGVTESGTVDITKPNFVEIVIGIALMLGLVYIAIYLIKGVFSFMTRQTIIVVSRYIEFDLKNVVYDHYQKLDLAFYKRNQTGDLMNRISEDVSKVRMYLGPAVLYTVNLVVLVILVVAFMLATDPELTLYALLPLPFMSIGIYLVSSKINRRSEEVQRQQSTLSTTVQESITGIRVLKAYSREESLKDQFRDQCDVYKFNILKLVKIEALFMPIIVLMVGLSTILTIYIGGLKVIEGTLLLGDVFAFIFYVNLLTWPFASVGWVTSLVQKAEASMKRINEFLETEPEITNVASEPHSTNGVIEFKDVTFVYPDSGVVALQDVSFDIDQGKTLAIIGRTGSGKSTLASLISRQYDITKGEILIDNLSTKEHHLYNLRAAIGYVPQDVFLFSDTIYNNIKFGVDDVSESEVVQAAKDADVHENIIQFAEGYQTILGERGINLSGGQKQRVSIARAIIKKPDILIFDDCLSAVDTETEEKILSSLKRIMKDRTSIIISHRVSSIKHADKIIVLDEGKIAEQGTHASLIKEGGLYASLYQKQLLEEKAA